MKSIGSRVSKLEVASNPPYIPLKMLVLDGTREEVEKQVAELDAAGEPYIASRVVPYVGESINDFRRSARMAPLACDGWDEPRVAEGPVNSPRDGGGWIKVGA